MAKKRNRKVIRKEPKSRAEINKEKSLPITREIKSSPFQQSFKIIWKIIVGISVILAFYVFYPRVEISQGQSLDYYDPYKTPFIFTNNGYLSIHNFKFIIFTHNLSAPGISIKDYVSRHQTFDVGKIESNKSHTIFIEKALMIEGYRIEIVEIYMRISYQLFPSLLEFSEWYKFSTRISSLGEYFWYESPTIDSVVTKYEEEITEKKSN